MKPYTLALLVGLLGLLLVACGAAGTESPATNDEVALPASPTSEAAAPTIEPTVEPTDPAPTEAAPAEATPTLATLPNETPTPAASGEAPPVPEDLSEVVITMERTPCFGFCPVYSVTISGDGEVIYLGEQNVAEEGERTRTISEEQVRELVNEFYRVDFFNMRDRYEANVTDLPSTTTTITINGQTKSVYNYAEAPPELIELENKIDEIAGTAEWIGPR